MENLLDIAQISCEQCKYLFGSELLTNEIRASNSRKQYSYEILCSMSNRALLTLVLNILSRVTFNPISLKKFYQIIFF